MIHRVQRTIDGKDLILETGELATQAGGSVKVQYGETIVLATATMSNSAREGVDFLPLSVDIEERHYAIGKIPGSFFRREGRPTTEAVLGSRVTDRTIRPLIPKKIRNEIQVLLTVLSADRVNPHDTIALVGASAALTISNVPFDGPVSATRVGYMDGELVTNLTYENLSETDLDLVVAGSENAIVMVEGGAEEVDEKIVLDALKKAQEVNHEIIQMQKELADLTSKEKTVFEEDESDDSFSSELASFLGERLGEAIGGLGKEERTELTDQLLSDSVSNFEENHDESKIESTFDKLFKDAVRKNILAGNRPDGRSSAEIRELSSKVGVLPRAHGSSIFNRGQTQILNVATLGSLSDAQRIDSLSPDETKRYLHHYNFPPYSVGEVRRVGNPGRREIGHGALAERALIPVIPDESEFPYTIRLVSDVLGSNGSSSMGSVCASTLSLMDAGVPIKAPVAGIAMGLVTDEKDFVVLTDIQGIEDSLGDMDFKVAGTRDGITALQMDIKLTGITDEILEQALEQAKAARLEILDNMLATIPDTREELNEHAPRITKLTIDTEKIGALIGPGGKTIRSIVEESGATVDVDNDGTVFVGATDKSSADKAIELINRLTKDIEVGEKYTGKVVRTTDFGAFVELAPGKDGMVHISELADYHVPNVEDVVKVGDEVEVLVTEIDQTGRVRLSRKALLNGSEEGATIGTDGAEDTSTRRARPNRRPRSEDSNRPRSDSRKRPGRRRPEGSSRRQER
ncbi:MAG: polyribonucleotide nucleotidyltransferase [Chloroflexota bacterium]|nr:polyribonucleotide nucleotidyltransferase [Chloroflexota bacterium]